MDTTHWTCEICGEETPSGATAETLWADAPNGRRIHAGPCFLEFGIVQNTHAGSALREAIQRLCQLHRERARDWKVIATTERGRLRRQLLDWYEGDTGEESFPAAINRILPEEK
jgi:hypothetical protein